MIVYRLINKNNGKSYVGQTTTAMSTRWRVHCRKSKRDCPLISAAIQKHGKDNFTIQIVGLYSNIDQLNDAEEYFIQYYNSMTPDGYNIAFGGGNRIITEATKAKISKTLTGRPTGRKDRLGIPSWNKGVPWSNEIRKKLSESHKGRTPWCAGLKLTQEHKNIMSKAKLGKPHKALNKAIICMETGVIYESAKAASLDLGCLRSKICLVLKGKRNHTKGYTFKYYPLTVTSE